MVFLLLQFLIRNNFLIDQATNSTLSSKVILNDLSYNQLVSLNYFLKSYFFNGIKALPITFPNLTTENDIFSFHDKKCLLH